MTAIVGITQNKKVYMGADSAISTEEYIGRLANSKILKKKGLLIGGAGSSRCWTLIKTNLFPRVRQRKESAIDYVESAVVSGIRKIIKENGAPLEGYTFLIGYRGKLFEVMEDWGVCEYMENYAAIGSGYLPCLGSLYTTQHWKDPVKRINVALQASAKFIPSVEAPFTLEVLP